MQKLKERISRHIDLIEFSRGSGGGGAGWYIVTRITGMIQAGPFETKEDANEAFKHGVDMGVLSNLTHKVEYFSK